MRTVCFVERLEFEIHGNLFNHALALGDVDNDQGNELVVGNTSGELVIFKGTESKPWKREKELGVITSVGVGDVLNRKKNSLICLNAEGWCFIFDVKSDNNGPPDSSNGGLSNKENIVDGAIHVTNKQHLPPNSKVMLIADADGDGMVELVVGYSDRVVRMFRYRPTNEDGTMGHFELLEKWQLAGQIGSITVNTNNDGSPTLMAAQPGCTFCTLISRKDTLATKEAMRADSLLGETPEEKFKEEDTFSVDSVSASEPSLIHHPLASSRARNPGISTEIVGGFSCTPHKEQKVESSKASFYALCSLDGTLMLVDGDNIVWSLQVDHQLFGLSKLDVTGDGTDEVIVCSWDGQTYIVNHNRQVVRFHFEEKVSAFAAGLYAVKDGSNKPCLIYATFNNRLHVYHDISMLQVPSANLIQTMDKNPEAASLISSLNVDVKDPSQLRQLYHWCLYGHQGSKS